MNHWKIGVLGAANIAYRRFLPALQKSACIAFAGIASRDAARCVPFLKRFGGRCYPDYASLLDDSEINCIYVPLPPALHMKWGLRVLDSGKHLLMEKPFTTTEENTFALVERAEYRGLALHENYMFLYHRQLSDVKRIMASGELGDVRMIRTAFTFPRRSANDFRYNPKLGGGALLDCGGYPLRIALELLGDTTRLCWSNLWIDQSYQVDTAGSAVLQNNNGLTAHIFFGMDDTYRCELEVWGSKASLIAPRIFTAPPDYSPVLRIQTESKVHEIVVEQDDQFLHSIAFFERLLANPKLRSVHNASICRQSQFIQQIQEQNNWKQTGGSSYG